MLILAACNPTVPNTEATLTDSPATIEPFSGNYNGWKFFTARHIIHRLLATGKELWATTASGVIRWDLENGKQRIYVTQDGLGSNIAREIIRDSRGNIWVTCYTGGVSRFDGSAWQVMMVADGLPEGRVSVVVNDDKGNLWFGTHGGVSYYSK